MARLHIYGLLLFVTFCGAVNAGNDLDHYDRLYRPEKSDQEVRMRMIGTHLDFLRTNEEEYKTLEEQRTSVLEKLKEGFSDWEDGQSIRTESDLHEFKNYINTLRRREGISLELQKKLDQLEQSSVSMFVLQQQRIASQDSLLRLAKPMGLKDVFIRGFAGDNWKALKDYNPQTITEAIAAGTLFSSAGVMNKRFEKAIDRSLGGMLDTLIYGSYRSLSYYVKEVYYSVRNVVTGHSGRPLEVDEVKCWQDSVNMILRSLLKTAKDANMMGSRFNEKVLREGQDDDQEASSEWMVILASDIAELCYIANTVKRSVLFYNKQSDRSIIHYADQIHNLLVGIKKTVLEKTKSYRDLGTSDYKASLDRAQSSIDQYFKLLIRQLDSSDIALDTKTSTNTTSNGRSGFSRGSINEL